MTAYCFVKDEKWTDLYYLDTMNFAASLYDMKNCAAGVRYPRTRGGWGNFFRNKLQEHATLPSDTILYHSIDQYLCTENQSYITSQYKRNRMTGTSMPIKFSWPSNMLSFKCDCSNLAHQIPFQHPVLFDPDVSHWYTICRLYRQPVFYVNVALVYLNMYSIQFAEWHD